jgi:hypothetical protein
MSNPDALKFFTNNRVRYNSRTVANVVSRNETGRVKLTDLLKRRGQTYDNWKEEWGVEGLSEASVSQECDNANIQNDYVEQFELQTNLFLWYDAGYGVTTGSGNSVQYWFDKAHPTIGQRALTGSNLINGGWTSPSYVLSDYDYNGQAVITSGSMINYGYQLTASGDLTYYVVGNQGGTVYSWGLGGYYVSAPFISTNPFFRIVYRYDTNRKYVQSVDGGVNLTKMESEFESGNVWNKKHLFYLYHAAITGSNYSVDSLHVTASVNASSSFALQDLKLAIDAQGNPYAKFAEIMIYKGQHDLSKRSIVMNYLATKYGITLA